MAVSKLKAHLRRIASGADRAMVAHWSPLLSDNGCSYIAGELADWLADEDMDHVRAAPRHPQTQGKVERRHHTLKTLRNLFDFAPTSAREP